MLRIQVIEKGKKKTKSFKALDIRKMILKIVKSNVWLMVVPLM